MEINREGWSWKCTQRVCQWKEPRDTKALISFEDVDEDVDDDDNDEQDDSNKNEDDVKSLKITMTMAIIFPNNLSKQYWMIDIIAKQNYDGLSLNMGDNIATEKADFLNLKNTEARLCQMYSFVQ